MRFKEFKLLKEAAAATKDDNFYTMGDSHARGVGTAIGLDDAHNLAVNGAATTGNATTTQKMLANISKIPKGANVLISVGANDTANVVRANIDSQGKTKLPPASKIVGDVMKVVNAVKAQGAANIVFMLFPSGDNKKTQYYAGDFQKEVRDALRGSVGVKVIDYDGSPLQNDGVHYQFGVYKQAGEEARKIFGSSPVKGGAIAPAAPVGGKPSTGFVVQVPTGNRNPEVADVQKALVALGFPLPKHGVDGIKGPETSGAIRSFQQANKIEPSGAADQATVDALNAALQAKPDVLATLTKSTDADIKPSGGAAGPLPPLKQDSVTQGKVGKLLDFIARYESGGNYEIILGGKTIKGLTKATLNDVYQLQDAMRSKGMESTAVGRYQYIQSTLQNTAKQMGLDPASTVFDEKTQDSIATQTLRSIGLDQWLDGKLDDGAFLNKVARIWAGIPTTSGTSAYQGVGSNKAGTTTQTALNTLQDIKTTTA